MGLFIDYFQAIKTILDGIISSQEIQLDHIHSAQKTYPTLADGIQLTSGVADWALGNFVECIPANGIAKPFDIHQSGSAPSPMTTPIQPANTRISARCAVEDGGSKTINIALFYHEY